MGKLVIFLLQGEWVCKARLRAYMLNVTKHITSDNFEAKGSNPVHAIKKVTRGVAFLFFGYFIFLVVR